MCHCLLASKPVHRRVEEDDSRKHAYVDTAFEQMLSFFRRGGIDLSELEVKLFGGADVLRVLSGPKSVGKENLSAAQRVLAHHGLKLTASDIGGHVGRKVVFTTHTGSVQVHRMRSTDDQAIV